jgi:hypothetical protein
MTLDRGADQSRECTFVKYQEQAIKFLLNPKVLAKQARAFEA